MTVEYTADVEIKCDSDGEKRIGLWVRDSTAGIGTMTFYQPKTLAGAGLGHAVCDVDTGEILPLGTRPDSTCGDNRCKKRGT